MDRKTDIALEAYTVPEFCAAHRICRASFYNLPEGERPRVMRVGSRVLVSKEAAAEWRRAREAKAA
jgi:hypothetical protein